MREIILDTETTGLEPADGHKLVEIGCVELVNAVPTGRTYQQYINPGREVPTEAAAVHGITTSMVKDKPTFAQIYTDFLDFIGDAQLVIHNAAFDMKFINAELTEVGHAAIPAKRITDTLLIARGKFPGSPASLDALCRRFGVDNSNRELHGALLDAQLLAEVYLEMMGGRQHGLGLVSAGDKNDASRQTGVSSFSRRQRAYRDPRPHAASAEELEKHAAMTKGIKDPLWAAKK